MILDGKKIAKECEMFIKNEVEKYPMKPKLLIVTCDPDDASKVYLRNKTRAAKRVGIDCEVLTLDGSQYDTSSFAHELSKYTGDENIHGIIIQLPLPKHLDANLLMELIPPEKDVDGFGSESLHTACTPLGCLKMLEYIGEDVAGKHCVVIGRSKIVGEPLAKLLLKRNATVTVCHSHTSTEQLATLCKAADFVFSSAGVPNLIKKEYLKEGCVLIDISINRDENGNLCGDAEKDCEEVCSWITPVPGGVGPMTVAMLMMNVLIANWLTLQEDCDIINT